MDDAKIKIILFEVFILAGVVLFYFARKNPKATPAKDVLPGIIGVGLGILIPFVAFPLLIASGFLAGPVGLAVGAIIILISIGAVAAILWSKVPVFSKSVFFTSLAVLVIICVLLVGAFYEGWTQGY